MVSTFPLVDGVFSQHLIYCGIFPKVVKKMPKGLNGKAMKFAKYMKIYVGHTNE